MNESNARSIGKTISWRITGSSATFAVAYLISQNWAISGSIAIAQLTVNTVLYYIHERIWDRFKWGKLN